MLTGGASSVYGSDAVSGVVNFIMDTDFEGVRLDAQYSFYQHNNRSRHGHPGGARRARLRLSDGQRRRRRHLRPQPRDRRRLRRRPRPRHRLCRLPQARTRSPRAGATTAPAPARPDHARRERRPPIICGGSATSANGTVILNENGTSTFFQIGPNRTLIPGFTPYNFAPTNYFQRPDERYTLGAFANYEISPALQPYLEVMFMDDRTVAQIAPSGDFGNTFSINCGSPAAPTVNLAGRRQPAALGAAARPPLRRREPADRQRGQRRQRPAVHAAGRVHRSDDRPALHPRLRADPAPQRRRRRPPGAISSTPTYRIVAGMRGDLERGLVVRHVLPVRADQLRADLPERLLGHPSGPRDRRHRRSARRRASIRSAARCSTAPIRAACPGTSSPRARSSAAALAYLQTPGFQRGSVQQTVASASLTGNLGNWGMQVPLGRERRRHRGRRRVSQGESRAADRRRLPDAAVERSRRPGRADAAGRGQLRRPRGLRRGPHPDHRGQLHLQLLARSRLSLLRLRHRRPQRQHRHLQDRPRSLDRPRHPLPRRLQPRGPRAEHPGAVRAAARGPERQRRSLLGRRAGRVARRLPGDGRLRGAVRHDRGQPGRPV